MTEQSQPATPFNVVVVGQQGRLMYEALLFAASLRHFDPGFQGKLFIAEPAFGGAWDKDMRIRDEAVLAAFERLNATILPFEAKHFGSAYPYGNKIELLSALPADEPFIFFDSDTLIHGPLSQVPFDFDRPTASRRVTGTWPEVPLYGPGYTEIWKSLYEKFDLPFEPTLDLSQPDEYWGRYLYFNAGWFFGACPHKFGELFLRYALEIRDNAPDSLACQELDPWLDQVALPLVITALGGGRDTLPDGLLDGSVSTHYRLLPLLYARESDQVISALHEVGAPNWLKKILKTHEPMLRMIYQGRGQKVRALFDQDDLPRREKMIRNKIKSEGFWMR